MPRRTELEGVAELPPADRLRAGEDPIVHVAELHEAVPLRVHADAGVELATDQSARRVRLMIDVEERAEPGEKAGRPERPAAAAEHLAHADLRHEAAIGAK